jgi:hypothetical protein
MGPSEGPMRGDLSRGPLTRQFIIDPESFNYAVPAEIKLSVNILDQNSRRPVQLTIQKLDVVIRSIEIEPIAEQLKLVNGRIRALLEVVGTPQPLSKENPPSRDTQDSESSILDNTSRRESELQPDEPATEEKLETLLGNLRDLKEELSILPKNTAKETSLEIVGESYFRFNSSCQFYPTLIFHFKEEDLDSLGKRTQVKVRWTEFDIKQTFTSTHRKELEERLTIFRTDKLTYWSGPLRANYVSASSARWKTIMFVKERADAITILSKILKVLNEIFLLEQLSFTTGRKLMPATKVAPSLAEGREPEWSRICKMELNKVILQVNGTQEQMEIFRHDELDVIEAEG